MGVNSLPKTVTQQRHSCNLNPGPSVPESSTQTTRLQRHPFTYTEGLKTVMDKKNHVFTNSDYLIILWYLPTTNSKWPSTTMIKTQLKCEDSLHRKFTVMKRTLRKCRIACSMYGYAPCMSRKAHSAVNLQRDLAHHWYVTFDAENFITCHRLPQIRQVQPCNWHCIGRSKATQTVKWQTMLKI